MSRKQRKRISKSGVTQDRVGGDGRAKKMSALDAIRVAAEKLAEAESLRKAGKMQKAKRVCEELLEQDPDYVGALHTLGNIFYDQKHFDKAFAPLSYANALCPDHWGLLLSLGRVNLQLGRDETARTLLEHACELEPTNLGILNTLEKLYRGMNNFEAALKITRVLREIDPSAQNTRTLMAAYCVQTGRFKEAQALCEGLVQNRFVNLGLLETMCHLPKFSQSQQLLTLWEELESVTEELTPEHSFVHAQILHNLGNYGGAWEVTVEANAANQDAAKRSWESGAREREAYLNLARSSETLIGSGGMEGGQPKSLFVIGAPRAGKTTLENLLRGQPGIYLGGESRVAEFSLFKALLNSGNPPLHPECVLPPELRAALLEQYRRDMALEMGDEKLFISTGPDLAKSVLDFIASDPNCRIVFVRRNLNDLRWSIFLKSFDTARIHFANDLGTINEFLEWHTALADICVERFPEICRIVEYEEMVERPCEVIQTISTLCEMNFETESIRQPFDDRDVAKPYLARLSEFDCA